MGQGWTILVFRPDVFSMDSGAETSDAVFDVVGGGFWTIPAFGLQDLGYGSRARRGRKLKDTAISCLDTILLASPSLCDIPAAFFLERTMFRMQTPQTACSSGLA